MTAAPPRLLDGPTGAALRRRLSEALVVWGALPDERRNMAKLALTIGGVVFLEWLRRALFNWWKWQRWEASLRCLKLSSPLAESATKLALPTWGGAELSWSWPFQRQGWRWGFQRQPRGWKGNCPCCKRPIELSRCAKWRPPSAKGSSRGRGAFVINLWGASPAYVLGALVLGHSIRRTQTRHSLVCLHTTDVPRVFLDLLGRIWECREVEHIEVATESLSVEDQCERFEKVFTKLRGMQLTDFEKILVMDIDLLVRSNIDELFDLPAPAAMRRGMTNQYRHGDPVDGKPFFLGKQASRWSWGIGTGINAGVMLWRPDEYVFKEMISELEEPNHPSHMRGNGPEQDYLSRYWADAPWTHIGVQYNFQLHQMFYALHPDSVHRAERVRLLGQPEEIKIVHYSGVEAAKPWHRILDRKWADLWPDRSRDREYVESFAEEFKGYFLWVLRDPMYFGQQRMGGADTTNMVLDADGEIWRRPYWAEDDSTPPERLVIPEKAIRDATSFLETVLREWFDTLQDLEQTLHMDLRREMLRAADIARAEAPPAPPPAVPPFVDAGAGRDRAFGGGGWDRGFGGGGAARSPSDGFGRSAGPRSLGNAGRRLSWDRPPSGWWCERLKDEPGLPEKASALCCATPGRRLVLFVDGAEEVVREDSVEGGPLSGVFLKVVGEPQVHHFAAAGDGAGDVEQLRAFVQGVPLGSRLLLAILDPPASALPELLAALAPLGVPTAPPPRGVRAMAAVGVARPPEPPGDSAPPAAPFGQARRPQDGCWFGTHASADIAYVGMPR